MGAMGDARVAQSDRKRRSNNKWIHATMQGKHSPKYHGGKVISTGSATKHNRTMKFSKGDKMWGYTEKDLGIDQKHYKKQLKKQYGWKSKKFDEGAYKQSYLEDQAYKRALKDDKYGVSTWAKKRDKGFFGNLGKSLKSVGKTVVKDMLPHAALVGAGVGGAAMLSGAGMFAGTGGGWLAGGGGQAALHGSLAGTGGAWTGGGGALGFGGLSGLTGGAGDMLSTFKGAMNSDWGKLGMGALDAFGSYMGGKESAKGMKDAQKAANPFAKYRKGYAERLGQLYDDPSYLENDPGYQFRFNQGMKAMNATSAAKGSRLSGGAMLEAQQFGQGLAAQMRQQEIQNLSQLSGATMGFGGGADMYQTGATKWGGIQEGLGTIGGVLGYMG